MVQPAWPFWPDLRDPNPYGVERFRDYDIAAPLAPDVPPGGPPLTPPPELRTPPRARTRADLNVWRVPDRSQPTVERVLQGGVVTVLERGIPSRDPLVGEWWRVVTRAEDPARAPAGQEGYLAGTGPRGEPYLDLLPPRELPGFARTLQTLTVPREPLPGDPCLTEGGCLVYPPHVIDPNMRTRIKRSSLQASTGRIPKGGLVDLLLLSQVNVTITEREEDGDVFMYFTPEILGSHTFYKIRFCHPGTMSCVEGWTQRYNLVPGAVPGIHTPMEETTFWEDVGDFVTDPDTWAVIGAIATAGSYGWVAGILGSAQSVALQEAMKGLAGMFIDVGACLAAKHSVEECTIGERSPNFVNGWKAQVAIRARIAAVALAGPGVASAKAALAAKIGPDLVNAVVAIANTSALGSQYRELEDLSKKQGKTDEELRNEYLAKTQRDFGSDPDPMKRREDVQAIAINYHLRRNLFDTIHWDPVTGKRREGKRLGKAAFDPNRPPTRYTVEQLEGLWRAAEQRQAHPAFVNALRRRYERAKHLRDDLGITLAPVSEDIVLSVSPGGQVIEGPAPDIGGGGAGSGRMPLWKETLYGLILTSPAWVPLGLLPWLRKRWRPKRKRSQRAR